MSAAPTIPGLGPQAAQSALWASSQVQPTWGVYDASGNIVLEPDSVLNFGIKRDADLPTFPVQAGTGTQPSGFGNYNKVTLPFYIAMRFSKGGTQSDRTSFLQQIEALYDSIDLYTVITPEETYQNVNLASYEVQRRGSSGAFFLQEVDLYFQQIMQESAQYTTTNTAGTPTPSTANAKAPAAQPVNNVGTVQPQTPPLGLQSTGVIAGSYYNLNSIGTGGL